MSTTETQANVVEGIGVVGIQDASFSPEQREYLHNRWLHEVSFFARATRKSRKLYLVATMVAVFSGALTACASGLNVFLDERSIRWLIAGLGLITAISTSFSGKFQDWENWKRRSMTLERLKYEGRMFLLLAAHYRSFPNRGEAFKDFAQNVEQIVKEYKTEFFAKKADQQLENVPNDTRKGAA